MADANQSWTIDKAIEAVRVMTHYKLDWMEEPISADCPIDEWLRLAREAPMPLAAGENLTARAEFSGFIQHNVIGYVKPDLAKWGGVSGCFQTAHNAGLYRAIYCPHFLGGAVGLLASAHILAAVAFRGALASAN